MSSAAGFVLLDALLAATGLAVLTGLGIVRSGAACVRHLGLAFLTGWAACGVVVSVALMAGGSGGPWTVVVGCVAVAAAGLATVRRLRPEPRASGGGPAIDRVSGIFAVALAGFLLEALRRAHLQGPTPEWDAWAFWIPKAKTIYYFGGIDTSAGGFASFANPYYPPLWPAMDAAVFHFTGGVDLSWLRVQEWLLLVALLWAVAGLLAGRVPPLVLWAPLLALAVMPGITRLVGSGLADFPLAALVGVGALCGALWLVDGRRSLLAVASVLFAAAALTKSEGTSVVAVTAVGLVAGALLAGRGWRRASGAALALVVPAAVLDRGWSVFVRVRDIPVVHEYPIREVLHPSYLADRLDRLGTVMEKLPGIAFDVGRWEVSLPVTLLAALLVSRRARPLAVYVWTTVVLGLAGLVIVYWIGRPPVEWYIETSADRAVTSVVVFGACLLPLLLAAALDRRPEAPPRESR